MTDEFKAQFKKDYGPSYRSVSPDYSRCAAMVPDGGRSVLFHQCARKNGHGPHGAWCKTHDPDAVNAKREVRYAKWRAEWDKADRQREFDAACKLAVRQIAEGHNDPRGLCQSIIDKLEGRK